MAHPNAPAALSTIPHQSAQIARGTLPDATVEHILGLIMEARSANTKRTYASIWSGFTGWCATMDLTPLPATPQTVCGYISYLIEQGRKMTTITQVVSVLGTLHTMKGVDSPTSSILVKELMKGARRSLGAAGKPKTALALEDVIKLVDATPDTPMGARDRAVILLSFWGAFRRSEVSGLEVRDLQLVPGKGMVVTLRHSKTDQEGIGQKVAIATFEDPKYCAVVAVQNWLACAAIRNGFVIRGLKKNQTPRSGKLDPGEIAIIIKRHCAAVGLDPDMFAAHSLRSGFITTAYRSGASEQDRMRHARHKSVTMHRHYVQDEDLFTSNPMRHVKPPA